MKPSVLLIEDDPNRVMMFRQFLPHCTIFVTDRPTAAVAMIKSRPFEVVFLDYDLGHDIVGVEVLHALKRCNSCRPPASYSYPLWIVHSANEDGARQMVSILTRARAKVVRLERAWEYPDLEGKLRSYGIQVS